MCPASPLACGHTLPLSSNSQCPPLSSATMRYVLPSGEGFHAPRKSPLRQLTHASTESRITAEIGCFIRTQSVHQDRCCEQAISLIFPTTGRFGCRGALSCPFYAQQRTPPVDPPPGTGGTQDQTASLRDMNHRDSAFPRTATGACTGRVDRSRRLP